MSRLDDRQNDQSAGGGSRLPLKLLAITVGMFGFGFLLVPLYDVICEVTGLNGKTGGRYEFVEAEVDQTREVTVQFVSMNNAGMIWEFGPRQRQVTVHPGELMEVAFYARNPTDRTMIAQAIPSVSPMKAAALLHKTECFCFNQQELGPGEEIEMPLRFFVDQALPADVNKLTLSYTLFDITENFNKSGKTLSAN